MSRIPIILLLEFNTIRTSMLPNIHRLSQRSSNSIRMFVCVLHDVTIKTDCTSGSVASHRADPVTLTAMYIPRICLAVAMVQLYCMSIVSPQEPHNVTNWAKSRQKRFLIFQTQGVHKFVISIAMTIDLKDKRAWRSLSGAWNFQWQHSLPTTVLYWWNSTYFPAKGRSIGEAILPIAPPKQPVDLTAIFLYAMVENYMNNKGMNGRECLLRAICENAQVNYVGGVLDRIYQRLLTPEEAMESHYHDSFAVGKKGADCFETYIGCPRGMSVFDQFVYVDEVI